MPILDATAGQHLLQLSLVDGLAHDKIRHISDAHPRRAQANGGLNVIDCHNGSGPEISRQPHIAQFPGLDQPCRGEAKKYTCAPLIPLASRERRIPPDRPDWRRAQNESPQLSGDQAGVR